MRSTTGAVGLGVVMSVAACSMPMTTTAPAPGAASSSSSTPPTAKPVVPTLDAATPDAPSAKPVSIEPAAPSPDTQKPDTQKPDTQKPDTPDQRVPQHQGGLSYGQTARLRYFDITVQRFEHGKDGVSAAWRTQTCYTHAHPEAVNGRVRVSTGPWAAVVRDGEGGGSSTTVAVDKIGIDPTWTPLYVTRTLALGECQTGWIAIKHNNPDLQWLGISYQPADGDTASWQ